ncbi:MAG: hypothetical protein AB7P52_02865 [Alphaproteobacteria bacterium]
MWRTVPLYFVSGSLGAAAFGWASLVMAADADLLAQGDPSIGADGTVFVGDPCQSVTIHEPDPDVAYQPGIDVDGNPVAPAELGGASEPLVGPGHEYRIDLTTPLGDALSGPAGSGVDFVEDSEIGIGEVTVREGRVYFNGRPLDDQDEHARAEACAALQARQAD